MKRSDARELIATQLSFDKDMDVKHFEVVIRLLGGLLSGYQLTGDERLLKQAEDLGTRLLPAFDSPTGLPYVNVNLRTGKAQGNDSNPAETGTLLLEFGTLSKLTGNPVFYDKAKRALVETYKRRSKLDLVGERFDVDTGKWTHTNSHIGARIDSYYEYLWKCWKLFGDKDCLAMWTPSIAAANRYLAEEVDGALWYRPGRHAHRQAHAATNTARSTRSIPACSRIRATSIARARLQALVVRDVEPARHRARGLRLPQAQDHRGRLSAAPGNRRVGLVPVPPHGRPAVPRDGQEVVRGLRPPLPHRGRLRRHRRT